MGTSHGARDLINVLTRRPDYSPHCRVSLRLRECRNLSRALRNGRKEIYLVEEGKNYYEVTLNPFLISFMV